MVAGRSRGQGQSNERQINNLTQQCKQKFRTKQRRKIRADRRYIPSLKWIRDVDTTTTWSPSPCHKPTTRASNNKPSRRTAIQRKDDNTVRAHKRQCLKRGGRLGRQAVRARAYCRALGLSRNRRRVPCPVDAFARGRLHGHCPSTGRRARARVRMSVLHVVEQCIRVRLGEVENACNLGSCRPVATSLLSRATPSTVPGRYALCSCSRLTRKMPQQPCAKPWSGLEPRLRLGAATQLDSARPCCSSSPSSSPPSKVGPHRGGRGRHLPLGPHATFPILGDERVRRNVILGEAGDGVGLAASALDEG